MSTCPEAGRPDQHRALTLVDLEVHSIKDIIVAVALPQCDAFQQQRHRTIPRSPADISLNADAFGVLPRRRWHACSIKYWITMRPVVMTR